MNNGFNGMNVKAGEKYDFSIFMRNVSGKAKPVRIVLATPAASPRYSPKPPSMYMTRSGRSTLPYSLPRRTAPMPTCRYSCLRKASWTSTW